MKNRRSRTQTIILIIGVYCSVNVCLYLYCASDHECRVKEFLHREPAVDYHPSIVFPKSQGITDSLPINQTLPTRARLRPLEKTTKSVKSQPPTHAAITAPKTRNEEKPSLRTKDLVRSSAKHQDVTKVPPKAQYSTTTFHKTVNVKKTSIKTQNLTKASPDINKLPVKELSAKTLSSLGASAKTQDKHQNHFEAWGDSFRDALLHGIHYPFHGKTLSTCVNKCHPPIAICNITNQDAWIHITNARKLPLITLFPENDRFFPWEREFLPLPPMTDVKTLPDLSTSIVRLLTSEGVKSTSSVACELDQTLTFRLDLYDGYGNRRTHGNDRVLAWIIGYSRNDQNETYRAASRVNDLENGSYKIQVPCLWVGSIQLKVGIVYPREYLRLVLHHFRTGSHRFLTGLFKVGDIEEVTLCFGLPNIPGRPCLCNYTSLNGIPLYCGRPLDNRLTCQDLRATQQLNNVPLKNYTQAEAAMADSMSRPLSRTLVKHNINITVSPNAKHSNGKSLPSKKCDRSLIAKTWDDGYPQGFFNKDNTWTSLTCKGLDIDKQIATECLRNKTILLVGDANMLYLHQSLKSLIKCYDNKTSSQWAVHSVCKTQTTNTIVHFVPHEYPLYLYPKWNPLFFQGGVAKNIESMIPSDGKHIVLYHFFLHPISSHLSTLFLGLHNAKEAFKHLIQRNPQVWIGVRGPHVASVQWPKNHLFGGDVQGTFARILFKHVFKELWDRVVFLDGWEMTTAMENEDLYPPQYVADAMIKTFLSFYCD